MRRSALTVVLGIVVMLLMIVGIVMLALVTTTLTSAPYPTRMVVAGLLIPLPCTLLGWRLFR